MSTSPERNPILTGNFPGGFNGKVVRTPTLREQAGLLRAEADRRRRRGFPGIFFEQMANAISPIRP